MPCCRCRAAFSGALSIIIIAPIKTQQQLCCFLLCPLSAAVTVLSTLKAFEMFLDLTLAAFLIMGTFVSHKMIIEKMQMKKDRSNVRTDRKDAQKGGSDDDESDDEGVPAAVPLKEEKPKVVKAASRSDTLRRRA
jgi:hypothetical protein